MIKQSSTGLASRTLANPFKVGDRIKKKGEDEIMRVGDDWGELLHWGGRNADKTHIVTTCGRVLSVDLITKA